MNVRSGFARDTFHRCFELASATVFKFLYGITWGAVVIPFVNKYARILGFIPAVLPFFLAGNNGKGYNGNGNGYFFHIHKILIMVGFCKSNAKQLITIC